MKRKTCVILAALALALLALTACGSKNIDAAKVTGLWRSDVVGAEYVELNKDMTYFTYNEEGSPRGSGEYAIDGQYVVLGGKKKDDESTYMALKFVNDNELSYDGAFDVYTYERVSEVGE